MIKCEVCLLCVSKFVCVLVLCFNNGRMLCKDLVNINLKYILAPGGLSLLEDSDSVLFDS